MTYHSSTRVPVNDSYAALIGKAVYVFAYYEWSLIYCIQLLKSSDFVHQYSRGSPMTSGAVHKEFQQAIESLVSFVKVPQAELKACCEEFKFMIVKRNALIHAHPITDADGSQILAYQTNPSRPLPDMKWPRTEVESIIQEFDAAACRAGDILDRLRSV